MPVRASVAFLVLCASAAFGAVPEDRVQVVTVKREAPYSGRLSKVAPDGSFHLTLNSGESIALPGREIIRVTFPKFPASRGPVRIDLVGGDFLYGIVEDGDEDGIMLAGTVVSRVTIPLERVRVLQIAAALKALKEKPHLVASGGQDVAFRRLKDNVDRVLGTVETIGPRSVSLETSLGDLSFTFDRLVAVAFATSEEHRPIKGLHAVVLGADGSRITGVLKGMENGQLVLETPHGFTVKLAPRHISTLYFKGGDFVFVSDLDPVKIAERSFFPGLVWKHRRDQTTTGNPLRLRGVEYPKGLGVHAFCSLTYKLDGKFTRFMSRIGIDDEVKNLKIKGAAEFRVLVDGKVAYKSPLIRGLEPTRRVPEIDLSGAKELTLVVDFGDGSHAGDRADWAMALLVKARSK